MSSSGSEGNFGTFVHITQLHIFIFAVPVLVWTGLVGLVVIKQTTPVSPVYNM